MTNPNDPTSDRRIDRDTPRSSVLDEERVASMADEGGVSGALMEIEDTGERKRLIQNQHRLNRVRAWRLAAAAFVLVGLAAIVGGWRRRNA